MGHGKRNRPKKLGLKLRHIREHIIKTTQDGLVKKLKELGADSTIHSGYITDFEKNDGREPSLLTLLAYSKLSNISINDLVDDTKDISMPLEAPIKSKSDRSRRIP